MVFGQRSSRFGLNPFPIFIWWFSSFYIFIKYWSTYLYGRNLCLTVPYIIHSECINKYKYYNMWPHIYIYITYYMYLFVCVWELFNCAVLMYCCRKALQFIFLFLTLFSSLVRIHTFYTHTHTLALSLSVCSFSSFHSLLYTLLVHMPRLSPSSTL